MNIFKKISEAIRDALWPERHKFTQQSDAALNDKLKGLDWEETEDPETTEKLARASELKGDSLASTVFTGRPQNPFSKDT